MDAPLCKTCKTRHYSTQPHKWDKPANKLVKVKPVANIGVNKPEVVLTKVLTDNKRGVNKDRNSDRHKSGYMRDYMRRRRASV